MSELQRKAMSYLSTHKGCVTCSMLGLFLFPTPKPTTNRAREGGAVLRRLLAEGLVTKYASQDGVHTVWVLTGKGRVELEKREILGGPR